MASQHVPDLQPAEAWAKLQEEQYTFLDVRTKEEFSHGHVPPHKGSTVCIPVKVKDGEGSMVENHHFIADVQNTFPDKDAPIMVGCKSGARSTHALHLLQAAGYTHLVHQCMGWNGWEAAGLPKAT
uniref:Rhodanese domain-containing protein n=1 Tax=Chlamydomonas leiostraca TaxID=1034604 RepID=A0A7S0WTR6_9CHLO|eukprot:CAMPEP_0202866954 /NCGR_PEP_ID=MMETSP1391-20130828/8450_1 /ASSEMBLY_ACC=CAM_ASM_000867 /TAXON_ID=1034604 /ORGANISM="Chlamydomonas leiostraca, Strain SAG 11-49" /LENGTH=125 /DNA_ID=CAMNT_0049546947 /DNA_START=17 /DNA_END=394 /DNA_ORIENTATION=+